MHYLFETEKPVLISILITAALTVFLYIYQPEASENIATLDAIDKLINMFYALISSTYIIVLIRVIRGKIKTDKKPPYLETELTIWDYSWRYFVVAWVASFTLVIAFLLPMETALGKIVFTSIILAIIPLIILVMFGENRIDKLKYVLSFITGSPRI
ncbi:MAG TPA: hypothetical protein ENJ28_07450 [Gammaproteobacteria bacterium]|nr:hypothetical protein [Gammaproteobacteria bacterium]